ncbi:hypothetical protein D3C85_1319070 [compost metagenome]
MNNRIKISEKELKNVENDVQAYLFLFLSKYYQELEVDPTVEYDPDVFGTYGVLVAYNVLHDEILEGGFLGMILNGYGNYIFNDRFAAMLKKWGIVQLALNVENAKEVYRKNIMRLEKLILSPDISSLYCEFPEFNALDRDFLIMIEEETLKVKKFIQSNLNDFAILN